MNVTTIQPFNNTDDHISEKHACEQNIPGSSLEEKAALLSNETNLISQSAGSKPGDPKMARHLTAHALVERFSRFVHFIDFFSFVFLLARV